MMYFRECPRRTIEDEDALDFVFKFANEYTEESVRSGYTEQNKAQREKPSVYVMMELGRSAKDILGMDRESLDWEGEEEDG